MNETKNTVDTDSILKFNYVIPKLLLFRTKNAGPHQYVYNQNQTNVKIFLFCVLERIKILHNKIQIEKK